MQSLAYVPGSNGTANASLMTVQSVRSIGATTILVNTVSGVPTKFYASMGTPHTFTDPVTSETITVISEATAVDFAGHVDSGHIEIDAISPGYSDLGSAVGDIIVIRPITEWANNIFNVLSEAHDDDGALKSDSVGTAQIQDEAVTTALIDDDAVSPAKIGDMDWGKLIDPLLYTAVSGTWTPTDPNNGISGNPYFYTIRSNAQNDYIEFKTVLKAGTYSVGIRYDKDVNRGVASLSMDGVSTGSTIDMYAASRIHATFANFTTSFVLATSKLVTIRITMASKHASSIGYILGLYGVVLRRSA